MTIRQSLALCSLLASFPFGSSSCGAVTLDEAMAMAFGSAPSVGAAMARVRGADEGVSQATSGWRPTVTLSGTVGRGNYSNNAYPDKYETARTPRTMGLSISQPLYSGGRTVAATAKAEREADAERARLDGSEQSVLLAAAEAYLSVSGETETLRLSEANERILGLQLEAVELRWKVGEISRTDVSQAQARLARAKADRIAALGALNAARANYQAVVGSAPDGVVMPASEPATPATRADAALLASSANPAVRAAERSAEAARDGVDATFGELLPTVALTLSATRALQTTEMNSATISREASISVSVPLYEGGATHSRVRAAKHLAGQRRLEVDQARRDAVESAEKAWESLTAARAMVSAIEVQEESAALAKGSVEEEAKLGSRTLLDVLNAEQELFDARVSMVRARKEVLSAAYRLRSSVGALSGEALGLTLRPDDARRSSEAIRGRWFGTDVGRFPGYGDD